MLLLEKQRKNADIEKRLQHAASAGFYESPNGKKFLRVQLLTIGDLLEGKARAEHPDYEPDLNFKKARQEAHGQQKDLI